MKRILRWIGIAIGGVAVLLLLVGAGLYLNGRRMFAKRVSVAVRPLTIPSDSLALARGKHLADAVVGCNGCHTRNFAGQAFLDSPMFATIPAPNLTPGRGGIGRRCTQPMEIRRRVTSTEQARSCASYLLGNVTEGRSAAASTGKGGFFRGVLGFNEQTLGPALKQHAVENVGGATIEAGGVVNITGPMTGPNGRTANVTTAWRLSADGKQLDFVTAIPAPRP